MTPKFFCVFALLFSFSAFGGALGQTTPAKQDYSKEAFVIDTLRSVMTFNNDGTASRETTARVRVQSDAGVQQFGLLTFGYSSSDEQLEINYVRVDKPDGTVVPTPRDSIQDMPSEVTRVAPMYTDYREKHVAVRGLSAGDTLEYQSTSREATPLIPGEFWFSYDFDKAGIVLDEELQISVPKDRAVTVKSSSVKPSVTEAGDRRVYLWKTSHVERKPEDALVATDIPPPAVQITTFRSWDEVGRWWGGLERERAEPTPEIRAEAAALTQGAQTDADKARVLYQYVATKFRYISISFGIGRFQPHAAADVLKNEYGDCKDKHTLLASLLQTAGIESYSALINSTRKIDPDVPSPAQFDHVITVVPQGQNPQGEKPQSKGMVWLDTTTEVAPFGFLTFNLRDKQALVVPPDKPSMLVKTPPDPPFKTFQTFDIDGKLSDAGTLDAKVSVTSRGDAALLLRLLFRRTAQAQWKDLVQGIARFQGFAGDVSDVAASAPEATDEPFHYSYTYTRKNFSDWEHHQISPALPPLGLPALSDDPLQSAQPVVLGAPVTVRFTARVELPKGYTPTLPAAAALSRDFAEFHSSYSLKDGVLTAERDLTVKTPEIAARGRDDYRAFQKAVSEDESKYVVLAAATNPAPTATVNAEAVSLFEQSRQAFLRRDLNEAADDLERAVKLDAKYKDAWVALAGVRLASNDVGDGLAAFRQAIQIDPKDPRPYMAAGFALTAVHRPKEAMEIWKELLKQDPNNGNANANLGLLLMGDKEYREAVPHLEAAVTVTPKSSSLELQLGTAYLETGSKEKAVAALQKAVALDPGPFIWNNVSFALADHNLDLSDAEHYGEMAVKAEEDAAARIDIDKLETGNLATMNFLAAYWDTLGWVYFRQGAIEKAQKFIEASWDLRQEPVVGDHLGQVYEKQGKAQSAIRMYELALGASFPPSSDIRAHLKRLVKDKSKVDAAIRRARGELPQMGRMKLGKLSSKNGSAEFFVLLAPGAQVEGVKFVSGEEAFRPLAKAIAAAKFKASLPDERPARLLRRGVLVCEGMNLGCDFTLFTVDSVHSIQ